MTSWGVLVATVVLAVALAGCGGDDGFGNEPRPAAEVTVGAAIAPKRVSVSPSRFGAGPIELIVSNQTRTSQRLTLESQLLADGGRELRQSTGPINPGDTASLKADLDPGTYTVFTADEDIGQARIEVGPRRESAQDRLLQP